MIRIVLFGAPGSGKGTMGDFLAHDFAFLKISTGDMIREEASRGGDLGQRLKAVMEQGNLVSDDLIIEMVQRRLEKENGLPGYILDGFPRTLAQAVSLQRLPADRELAIFLSVAEEDLVKRLASRVTCEKCNAIYNLVNKPPRRPGICDVCSGKLARRADDNEATIRQRIQVYHQQTLPVIEYFRHKDSLATVDGHGSPEAVYGKVKKIVS